MENDLMALMDPVAGFEGALAEVLAEAASVDVGAVVRVLGPPRRAEHGDIALPAHPFARVAGVAPGVLAEKLAARARDLDVVESATAVGPFVNVTWRGSRFVSAVVDAVRASTQIPGGLVAGDEGNGKTLVIEFSSPNAARKLAFHHLRGTVLGAALARLFEARGYDVIRLNHLGDYGHNIGQLLGMLDRSSSGDERLSPEELQALYVEANRQEAHDPEQSKRIAGEWLALFEAGDETAMRRWTMIIDSTREALDSTYARLGVHFDEYRGESRYIRSSLEVADKLLEDGVAQRDPERGSIFIPGDDSHQPIVLVNSRGISTYEGRDAAAAIERQRDFGFDRCLYLTDIGQGGRFEAMFAALRADGLEWAQGLEFVGFGQMRLGGRKAKTREGRAVSLDDVLDEVTERAAQEIAKRDIAHDDVDRVARQIGIGAALFGQMRMRRAADFDFDPDEAVSFRGETAPRVQYTHARICSILRKAGIGREEALVSGDPELLADPLEVRVAAAIAGVPAAARRAVEAQDPSYLTDAVLVIADAWAVYQTAGSRNRVDLRVLSEDRELRGARLLLAAATAIAIEQILDVLGVASPEAM